MSPTMSVVHCHYYRLSLASFCTLSVYVNVDSRSNALRHLDNIVKHLDIIVSIFVLFSNSIKKTYV